MVIQIHTYQYPQLIHRLIAPPPRHFTPHLTAELTPPSSVCLKQHPFRPPTRRATRKPPISFVQLLPSSILTPIGRRIVVCRGSSSRNTAPPPKRRRRRFRPIIGRLPRCLSKVMKPTNYIVNRRFKASHSSPFLQASSDWKRAVTSVLPQRHSTPITIDLEIFKASRCCPFCTTPNVCERYQIGMGSNTHETNEHHIPTSTHPNKK